tara:strand:+ start:1080 stop:1592 length:513 start_codon:yes stop_codon:yes gene_type:complete
MQCIICLIEDEDVVSLQCISSSGCKFHAHASCISEWHKVINKYECPICHFILPNEIKSNQSESENDNENEIPNRIINYPSDRMRSNRVIQVNTGYDSDAMILERISRINIRRAELLNNNNPRVIIRNRINDNQLIEEISLNSLRDNQKKVVCLCSAMMIIVILVGCVAFI